MKKVIGIFMTMVLLFVVSMITNVVIAENVTKDNFTESEVYDMVTEWSKKSGIYGKYDHEMINGIYCTKGVLSTKGFKELTGNDFTLNGLEDFYYNIGMYDYDLDCDVNKVEIKVIGLHENYEIYRMDITTKNIPLGNYQGIDYYNGSIIFMIYEDD